MLNVAANLQKKHMFVVYTRIWFVESGPWNMLRLELKWKGPQKFLVTESESLNFSHPVGPQFIDLL